MVQADEKKIQAIINTVKTLPVKCEKFEDADSWVGIVLELENILNDTVAEETPEEVVTDG